jgi:multiple sugar transport system substrate-binding protein
MSMDQNTSPTRFSRRNILKIATGAAGLALLTACAPAATPTAAPKAAEPTKAPAAAEPTKAPAAAAPTQAAAAPTAAATKAAEPAKAATGGAFDWKKFKGEKIEVQLTTSPRADLLLKYQKEFEDLTGITVGAEAVPEQQARQKQVIEFTSGATSFDITLESWHVQKRLFGKGKWLLDLREFLADKSMTAPDYDWADFSKSGVAWATQADGRIDTAPLNIDYWILYWNQELFKAKGIEYPKTLTDMVAAAKALNDPAKNISGFVARGLKNANVPVWTGFLLGYDVDSVNAKGEMMTDGPEAIESAKIYQDLLKNYAPKGVSGFNWNEAQTSFFSGQAAMWFDGIGFAPPLEDKTKSKVVGKVGYGITPAGPKKQHSPMFGDGMGISNFSKKKGPAYLYMQWATGKVMQARLLASGGGVPPRMSPFTDAKTLESVTMPKGWIDVLVESGKIGRPGLPEIVPVTEFRDTFGIALTNMIGGADPAAELKKATADFKPVLAKSEL